VNVENLAEALNAFFRVDAYARLPDYRDFAVAVALGGMPIGPSDG
jgi:hypothetical protein